MLRVLEARVVSPRHRGRFRHTLLPVDTGNMGVMANAWLAPEAFAQMERVEAGSESGDGFSQGNQGGFVESLRKCGAAVLPTIPGGLKGPLHPARAAESVAKQLTQRHTMTSACEAREAEGGVTFVSETRHCPARLWNMVISLVTMW
ncbi:unnamed protein product [Pleuronectes platessa]|uniref:Uncharacterized protein n=1 Tax=Pleuronectes platessa TaxID=8262 RepID=A0A9N7ZCN9_PLEPL|nr:unnamed protein product [Pleuronectes platessa]